MVSEPSTTDRPTATESPSPSIRPAANSESLSPTAPRKLVRLGLVAIVLAVAVNALVRVLALGPFGVPDAFDPLGWMPVINTTVAAVVGATVVYGVLTRVSSRPDRTFVIVAVVVLTVSFAPLVSPPSFLDDAPRSVLATLGVMHLTTAAVVVGVLVGGVGRQRNPR